MQNGTHFITIKQTAKKKKLTNNHSYQLRGFACGGNSLNKRLSMKLNRTKFTIRIRQRWQCHKVEQFIVCVPTTYVWYFTDNILSIFIVPKQHTSAKRMRYIQ